MSTIKADSPQLTRRRFLRHGITAGAGLMLVACGNSGSADTDETGSATAATGGEPSTKPDKLIVRSWSDPWSTTIGNIPGQAFTDETGIPVEFDLSDIGEVQTKIQQALDAGQRPPVDVVYTIAPFAYTAGVQNLAIPLDPGVVTNFGQLTSAGAPEGGSFYVNIYTYTIPVIFNKDETSFSTGDSISQLQDGKYVGRLFVAPNFSPLLYPYAKMLGLDLASDDLTPAFDEIARLQPSIAAVGDDTVLVETMKSGEVAIGIGGLIGNVGSLQEAGVNAEYAVAAEGSTLTADSMYVVRGLPDDVSYYAQLFLNYVIDARLQTEWCAEVATVPTNSQAKPAEFMAGAPGFPFSDDEIARYAIIEPVALAAENNDAWQTAYTNAIQATGSA